MHCDVMHSVLHVGDAPLNAPCMPGATCQSQNWLPHSKCYSERPLTLPFTSTFGFTSSLPFLPIHAAFFRIRCFINTSRVVVLQERGKNAGTGAQCNLEVPLLASQRITPT